MRKVTDTPVPASDRGPTQAAEKRVREIVHEAARLFDRVGYHNTNMEMVAQAANMRKPTLYHYIKSKEEILLRIHQTLLDDLIARHKEKAARGLSREELLLGNITDILGHIARNRGYVRALLEHYRNSTRRSARRSAAHDRPTSRLSLTLSPTAWQRASTTLTT